MSAAPPPYTTRLSTTRLRTAQRASCSARFASSTICGKVASARRVLSVSPATHHLVAAPDEDRHGPRVCALLDDQHLVSCGPERHFANDAGLAELLCREVFETRDDATIRCDSNELGGSSGSCIYMPVLTAHLDLGAADPPHSGQIVLHKQMIRLVVEAPLADHQVRTGVLHPLDHVLELALLVLPQLLVLFYARDVQLMLRLRTRRLERTCEDRDLRVLDGVRHLWVGEVFVDEHALDERGVGERASDLSVNFDQVEWHVLPLEVCDREHCINSNLCELIVLF